MLVPDSRGFTLLETVVALTILSLVGIGVMGAFAAEQRTTAEAWRVTEAAALAQDRMALLTLTARDDLARLPDSLRHGGFDIPLEDYRWEAEVESVPGRRDLYEAHVRISWPDDGRFEARTMLHRPRTEGGGP